MTMQGAAGAGSSAWNIGGTVAKPNYHQARKQKELARKARQQEKQQRRLSPPAAPGGTTGEAPPETPATQP